MFNGKRRSACRGKGCESHLRRIICGSLCVVTAVARGEQELRAIGEGKRLHETVSVGRQIQPKTEGALASISSTSEPAGKPPLDNVGQREVKVGHGTTDNVRFRVQVFRAVKALVCSLVVFFITTPAKG